MNIKISENKTIHQTDVTELFEHNKASKATPLDNALKNLYKFKSKQFVLENDTILGNIGFKQLKSIPLSLCYHFEKSYDEKQFVESVKEFLLIGEIELSNNDYVRLIEHYRKYSSSKK